MSSIPALVDDLFRRSAARMTTALTRMLGAEHLELAEEVVQEAMLKALQLWPMRGVPENPRGWLFQVARNGALDRLRRRSNIAHKLEALGMGPTALPADDPRDPVAADDELRMIVLCCHPTLSRDSRVALTLKLVGGFGVNEIARAFLSKPKAIAQRLVRAKNTLREHGADLEFPAPDVWPHRLEAILDVLYLMFNEGYAAHEGDALVRTELCHEAIRLGDLLTTNEHTKTPALHALLALMHLQASRLRTRADESGALVRLEDQDRGRWDRAAIARGMRHLERSAAGDRMTSYHIEAAIAAVHASAPSYDATDWPRLITLYDDLIGLSPSPVVALNRAVAIAMARGPAAGIEAARPLEHDPTLRDYYLLPATLGDLYARVGATSQARDYFERALDLRCSEPERRFLRRRLSDLKE